ncbi:MAG: ArnT family glycosyltransferase [Candidatus Binataceae bacterium]
MTEARSVASGVVNVGHQRRLLFIALGAMLLRLAPLLQHGTAWATFNSDSQDYLQLAQGLNTGCGYARAIDGICSSPEALRLPGYPVFLAMMPSIRGALIANALLGAAVCFLVGLFSTGAWGPRAGIISALLIATDVPSIALSSQVMSDPLFQSLLVVGFLGELSLFVAWGTARTRQIAAFAGLGFLAIATLVRPIGIILPFLAALPFLLDQAPVRRTMATALLAVAIVVSPVVAWAFRNQRTVGVFTYSTEAAVALYYYGAAGTIWWRSHDSFESVKAGLEREMGVTRYSLTPAAREHELVRKAVTIIENDPVGFVLLSLLSLFRISVAPEVYSLQVWFAEPIPNPGQNPWFITIAQRVRLLTTAPAIAILVILQFAILTFIWLGVGRAVLFWFREGNCDQRRLVLVLLILTLALLVTGSTPGGTGARYRAIALPFLAMLAASGWSSKLRVPLSHS